LRVLSQSLRLLFCLCVYVILDPRVQVEALHGFRRLRAKNAQGYDDRIFLAQKMKNLKHNTNLLPKPSKMTAKLDNLFPRKRFKMGDIREYVNLSHCRSPRFGNSNYMVILGPICGSVMCTCIANLPPNSIICITFINYLSQDQARGTSSVTCRI